MDQARPCPFDLNDSGPYQEWRSAKLSRWPTGLGRLRVRVERLAEPTADELAAISAALARANLALIACPDPVSDSADLLAFGRRLGLERLDTNLCADDQAVSAIAVRPAGATADYIPYTDGPLSWHTDGYYNPADRRSAPGCCSACGTQPWVARTPSSTRSLPTSPCATKTRP